MKIRTNVMALLMLLGSLSFAQNNEFTFPVKGKQNEIRVEITDLLSDIEIIGISGSQLKIQADGYEGVPEKAKGLKPLTAGAPDNTDIGLSVIQEGNKIRISMANSEAKNAFYKIFLPNELNLYIDYSSPFAGDLKVSNMNGEVELKSLSSDLSLMDVTGPLVINSVSSDVNITVSELSQMSPSSINATSGDIDLTLPPSAKGTFKLSTMSGGVYTDLDFDIAEGGKNLIMGSSSTANLNGGGVEVALRCISGDIYIRKAE